MKILVACEESQTVTKELRKLGHIAFSCDLLPCSGGHPEWHIKGDAVKEAYSGKYDMMIAHPPCTYLTVTGNRWFNIDRYGDKAVQRHIDRDDAVKFFMSLVNAPIDRIAVENPIGVISSIWRKPDQIIQPYQFGDPYEKKTCLWLKGLPALKHTDEVLPPKRKEFSSGKSMPAWYAEAWKLPKDERTQLRSKTFPGMAKAMAKQWTKL